MQKTRVRFLFVLEFEMLNEYCSNSSSSPTSHADRRDRRSLLPCIIFLGDGVSALSPRSQHCIEEPFKGMRIKLSSVYGEGPENND